MLMTWKVPLGCAGPDGEIVIVTLPVDPTVAE
jgi:hypothetical protein